MFAYIDCFSGISGDMLLGALIDLGVSVDELNEHIQSILPQVHIEVSDVSRCNMRAKYAFVHCPHEHVHRHLSDIFALLDRSSVAQEPRRQVKEVFQLLAEAEAKVHGVSANEVHFHEVGAADSIADITGCIIGLHQLGITEFMSSPVPTGTGTVKIAHGTVPIPAPATAELLTGIPLAPSHIPFELTTPTGAVLLKYFVKNYGSLPALTIRKTGIGAGMRELPEQPNVLRVFLGESVSSHNAGSSTDFVVETNIDDMSGELLGCCVEKLWTLQPLDVWVTPIQMKKQRPAVTISVLCRKDQIDAVETFFFLHTTTLGVRRYPVDRTMVRRERCMQPTPWGPVEATLAFMPDGTHKVALEYEDAKALAEKNDIPLRVVFQGIRK